MQAHFERLSRYHRNLLGRPILPPRMVTPPLRRHARRPLARHQAGAARPPSLLHRLGYRFRLHRRDLPVSPDIVLPGRRAVVFVHGCFWHAMIARAAPRAPKANAGYWSAKLAAAPRA